MSLNNIGAILILEKLSDELQEDIIKLEEEQVLLGETLSNDTLTQYKNLCKLCYDNLLAKKYLDQQIEHIKVSQL